MMGTDRRGRWLVLVALLVTGSPAVRPIGAFAAAPEVVRVKVPASKVSSWFPKGTELISLSIREFDALLQAARTADSGKPVDGPVLLRASHRASWINGVIHGETTLDIRRGSKSGAIGLDPWNVVIDAAEGKGFQIHTSETGAVSLWLPSDGQGPVTYRWRAPARAGSEGRSFAIDLPRVAVSTLELDLPDTFVAERFVARGHSETTPLGHSRWALSSAAGRVEIRLRAAHEPGSVRSLPWVSGPTTVDVTPLASNWRCDWTVDLNGSHGPLTLAFSDGLEPLGVTGPGVASFGASKTPEGVATLTIQFDPNVSGTTPIAVRGVAPLRVDRPWAVPAARPVDGVWTGGTTTVRLDRSHLLESCKVLQGRRVSPPVTEATEAFTLLFEPQRPEPPAELTFLKKPPLNRAEVRGFVLSSQGQTRLTALIRWTLSRAEIGKIAFDFPRDWSLENITQEGEPLTWHAEVVDAKTSRIHMLTPPRGGEDERFEVRIEAVRKTPPGTADFELPRVRPVGLPVGDELWIAAADGGRVLAPRAVEGVAWIDPALVPSTTFHPEIAPSELDHALAWRFIGDSSRLSAAISAPPREVKSSINGSATLTKNRIDMDWRITVQPGSSTATLVPIFLNTAPTSPLDWRIIDHSRQSHVISPRELTVEERLDAGFPREGGVALGVLIAGELGTAGAAPGPIQIHATSDDAWTGTQAVPLLSLAATLHARATLTLNVDPWLLPKLTTHRLETVEPLAEKPASEDNAQRLATRPSHRFNYQGPEASLTLSAAAAQGESPRFFVTSATLQSTIGDDGAATHRLTLNLITRAAATDPLTLTMPGESQITGTSVDGRAVTAAQADGHVLVPLDVPSVRPERVVVLEYATTGGKKPGVGSKLTPAVPRIEAACHSFLWRLALPAGWRISRQGASVFDDGIVAPGSVATLVITGGLTDFVTGSVADARSIQRLQDTLAVEQATVPTSPTLATWLSRIDAEGLPVLVDAPALAQADLSPTSPPPFQGQGSWTERRTPARFERGDLVVIPVGSVWLVTTRRAALARELLDPAESARIRAATRDAQGDGDDPTERFQHAHSWGNPGKSWEPRASSGKSDVVLRGNGWPTDEFWCEMAPAHQGIWLSTIVASVLAAIGLLVRSFLPAWRVRVTACLVAVALASIGMGHYVPAWLILGIWMGAIGVVLACRPQLRSRTNGADAASASRGTTSSRSDRERAASAIAPLTWLGPMVVLAFGSTIEAQAPPKPGDLIIVLLPYDGVARVDVALTHVVMRLADLERLKALANPVEPAPPARVEAIEARHRCAVTDPKTARITSEYLLISSGEGAVEWRLPSEGAWNLRATLDDHELPVRIVDDGNAAVVSLNQPGRHRLVFERLVRLVEDAGAEQLVVAVNPVAFTRVEVTKTSLYPLVELEYPLVRSGVISTEVAADLGVTRTIAADFRLRPAASPPRETFTALALWDARAAGDLVRFRITPSGASPVSRLRLAVAPGTQVRFNQGSRLADQRWEGSAAKPEWVATFDPPFRRAEEILVDVWKPLTEPSKAGAETVSTRRSPPVEVAGNATFSGVIAFRRPSDWTGRLNARSGFDPIDEETFVKAWGALPNDPLTLAGASGFGALAAVSVDISAPPPRFTAKPTLRIELGEGRLDASLEADLVKLHGQPTAFDLIVPAAFVLDEFTVDGLASLSRPEPGRLHVELRPEETEPRKLALRGHLAIRADNPLSEGRRYRTTVPWIGWRGVDEQAGQLTLSAVVRPQLTSGPGIVPLSVVDQFATGTPAAVYRAVFQVNQSIGVGDLVWQAAPPNVKVRLLSHLTMSDESLQLNTSIRYAVTGGPIEVLYLKVPTTWAADFQIDLLGEATQRIAETRGDWTLWTLRPGRPIWGSARLVVRASRPCVAGVAVGFPDLIPLGHGSADRILAIERQTLLPLEIEGSPGLQSVDLSRVTDVDLFDINLERVEAYRVRGDIWGLTLLVRGDRAEQSTHAEPRVQESAFAISNCRGGASFGRARFAVEARRGSLFRFALAEPATVLAASIDGQLATALRENSGQWCVPINAAGEVLIDVYWSNHPKNEATAGSEIVYPRLLSGDVPAIFQVGTDPPFFTRGGSGLEEIPSSLWMLERVERTARRIVARIGQFDRSTRVDESRLLKLLASLASDAKATSESASLLLTANTGQVESISTRLARVREAVSESLIVNGLEDMNDALDLATPPKPADLVANKAGFLEPPVRGLFSQVVYFRTTPGLARPERKLDRVEWFNVVPAVVLPSIGLAIGVASVFVSGWVTRGLWRKSRLPRGSLVISLCVLGVFCPVPALFLLAMNLLAGRQMP